MLIPAKCTSCGDVIQVSRDKDTAICPSCGSAFIVEKAINNYGTIINAQKVEIHTDGITADNLLGIAIEEARHKNYDKASSYITKARERGASHPIFRLVDAFLADYKKTADPAGIPNRINALLQHLQQAHTLLRDIAQNEPYRGHADEFYRIIEDFTYSEIGTARQATVEALRSAHSFAECQASARSCYKLACSLEEFVVWGGKEGYFSESDTASVSQAKQRQSWAGEIMECLRALSLCYIADLPNEDKEDSQSVKHVLSAAEAQRIYDIAEKIHPLLQDRQPLEPRLISPSKGGEGVHTHRIKSEDSAEEHSVSDRVYFSGKIENLPELISKPSLVSGLLWGAGGTLFTLLIAWPLTYWLWRLLAFVFGQSFALCYTISAVSLAIVAFVGGTLFEGGYYGDIDTYAYKKLFNEWSSSPAHGAQSQAFTFSDFSAALEPDASELLEKKASILLKNRSKNPFRTSNALKSANSKTSEASDGGNDSVLFGKATFVMLIAVLIAAYFAALRWCPDQAASSAEPEPVSTASVSQTDD
ncbi:zinc ribbon domain-containing protein [bacterium]|nr:zinc ribbon domain-containing protein [bacterium]